jgi:hypothetical protein
MQTKNLEHKKVNKELKRTGCEQEAFDHITGADVCQFCVWKRREAELVLWKLETNILFLPY